MQILLNLIFFSHLTAVSKQLICECIHVTSEQKCKNSSNCSWDQEKEKCFSKLSNNNNAIIEWLYCSQFDELECSQNKKCAFHLGKCVYFTQCSDYLKEKCTQTSEQCISNGQLCIQKAECEEYLNQQSCQNLNKNGKYCIWKKNIDLMQCFPITLCNELPKDLSTDRECRKQLNYCTTSQFGGCINQVQYCDSYKFFEQCYISATNQECFWDKTKQICLEKICHNLIFKTHSECQSILPTCTSNGENCIDKSQCTAYTNFASCIVDTQNKKCIYFNNFCYLQNCMNAPAFATTSAQCQLFGNQCVPKKNGGCKDLPETCELLETEDSCLTIEKLSGQLCFWKQAESRCKVKQCNDAPLNYRQLECKTWLAEYECIGGEEGGCIQNVINCNQIKNLDSCQKNKLLKNCVIQNNECVEEICENLKFPYYTNNQECEQRLSTCMFDSNNQICIGKVCKNLGKNSCFFDNEMNKCILSPGCQHKLCESASLSYATYQECQDWDVKCTVNVLFINGVANTKGCFTKYLDCSQFLFEQQCISTLQDIPCYWNNNLSLCEFQKCENAPLTLTTIEQCQNWVKYHNQICINKQNGGCVQQPNNCNQLNDEVQCLAGTLTQLCFWNPVTLLCEIRTCENGSLEFNTNLLCRQWLSTCILSTSGKGCQQDLGVYQACSDAPDIEQFNNHQECQAWNPKCTLKFGYACANKLECSQYLKQEDCITDINELSCQWDGTLCKSIKCSDYPGTPLYQWHCQQFSQSCTITDPTRSCVKRSQNCSDYLNQQDCVINNNGQRCTFDRIPCQNSVNQIQLAYWVQEKVCLSYGAENDFQYYAQMTMFQNYYQFQYQCILKPNNCQEITLKEQCNNISTLSNQLCQWNEINNLCEVNISNNQNADCTNQYSTTQLDCLRYGQNCELNLIFSYPQICTFQDCSTIPESKCNWIILNKFVKCFWNKTICQTRKCSDIPFQPDNAQDCLNWLEICSFEVQTQSCFERQNCSIEKLEYYCNQSMYIKNLQKIFCFWNGTDCQDISLCSQVPNPLSHTQCQQKLTGCKLATDSNQRICVEKQRFCHYYSVYNCNTNLNNEYCCWDYQLKVCQLCNQCQYMNFYSYDIYFYEYCQYYSAQGSGCVFNANSFQCEYLKECQDVFGNQTNESCQFYSTFCSIDEDYGKCQLNQKCQSSTTYKQSNCNKYLMHKQCRNKYFTQSCQPLAQNCSWYQKITCLFDYKQNQCYWSENQQSCIQFSCELVEEAVMTHQDCQSYSNNCTIKIQNGIPNSCQQILQNCNEYQYEQECYVDSNQNVCAWINRQCIINNCIISPKSIYTVNECEMQFGSNCTINQDRSGCIIKLNNCSDYNKFQCLTPDVKTLSEAECFWDQNLQICSELLCHQAPPTYNSLALCESFHKNCETSTCRLAECKDFKYQTDLQCSIVMPKNQCTSNGQACIQRKKCENSPNQIGCTFSIEGNDCQWIDDKNICLQKTCDTAPKTLLTLIDCQKYLPQCMNKKNGGCIVFDTCNKIQTEETCILDINNQNCVWDPIQQKCMFLTCESFCGDGVVGGNEQCDDGNITPYDGCHKCQIQCQYGCVYCEQNFCYECAEGYELSTQGVCKEICGDGLIIGQEECEDMNQIDQDGCFQCKFQCHKACLLCYQGVCLECINGWDMYNDQCRSVCGNGALVPSLEQCDDGNIENFDGCNFKCQIEENWQCTQSSVTGISNCESLVYPKMILENLSQKKDSEQILLLSFNQALRLTKEVKFEDIMLINISNNTNFTYYTQAIEEASQTFANIQYKIFITIYEQFDNPQATFSFPKSLLVNEKGLELQNLQINIGLGTPMIFSLSALQKLNSTISFNEIMIYVFIGSSTLSVLTGNFDLFFNMLALLQQLSYVHYLNIPYPHHLKQYIKVFKIVSFQPLYDKLQIDQLFKKLNFEKTPFLLSKSSNSQTQEESNAFFMINAKSFYITFFTTFLLYLISKLILNFQGHMLIHLEQQKNQENLKKRKKMFYTIHQFAHKTYNYFFYSGLIKVFISTQYQLMYSTYNQFPQYKFSFGLLEAFEFFNSFNAIVILVLSHSLIFHSIIQIKKKSVDPRFQIYYENVKQNYWSKYYTPFTLIKVSIYMGTICFMYQSPVIQIITLTISNNIFCFYLVKVSPLNCRTEQIKVLSRELIFSITVSGFFLYCLDVESYILNIFGWIHIGLFSSILSSNLVVDFVKQIQTILDTLKTNKENQLKKQQQIFISNQLTKFIEPQIIINGQNNKNDSFWACAQDNAMSVQN